MDRKRKVLVVDDETEITYFISRGLKKNNYEVFVAHNLKDAETLVNIEKPDFILLDNHLPDGFGIDYAPKLNTNNQVIIVMITAHDSPQDRLKAKQNGVHFFIAKPFEVKQILDILNLS